MATVLQRKYRLQMRKGLTETSLKNTQQGVLSGNLVIRKDFKMNAYPLM